MPTRQELDAFLAECRSTGLTRRLLELARDEDLGAEGDVTSLATIPADRVGRYAVVPRQEAVLAGLGFVPDLLEVFGTGIRCGVSARDGETAPAGRAVAVLDGPVREILAVERTLLNLVGRLSGIATRTARFIAAMGAGARAELCDTRKTTPGLRVFEKYAVRCGGGRSHRLGLHDAMLIKDNHLAGCGVRELAEVVRAAAARAAELRPGGLKFCETEVDSLEQFAELLRRPIPGLNIVLLDNMSADDLRRATAMRDSAGSSLLLEASGGVNLDTIAAIAGTGVDRISVGSLTHGAVSLDFGLDASTA